MKKSVKLSISIIPQRKVFLGFEVTTEIFAENSKYFRNSLASANYTNMQYGITETTEYLEQFFHNLLMGEVPKKVPKKRA